MTIQGRREETLGRQGEGALFTSRLHWVVEWAVRPEPKAQPAARVRAGVKRPGHGRHPSAPLSVTGGPEPSPVCRSNGFGPSRSSALRRGHTQRSSRGQAISLTVHPRQQSRRRIFSPQIGAAFNIWQFIQTNVFKLGQPESFKKKKKKQPQTLQQQPPFICSKHTDSLFILRLRGAPGK